MRRFAFVLGCLALAGCVTQDLPYRDQPTVCERKPSSGPEQACPEAISWTTPLSDKDGRSRANVDLHVVELTEQGQFWDLRYLKPVLDRIQSRGDKQDIVLFIHGWHHDARASDEVLQDFHHRLVELGERNESRKTTGIYVGWRGETWTIPRVNDLTFWARKNVSVEVGRGALSELLLALREQVRGKDSRLIAVGHSFGASVLFSATKNDVIRELMQEARDGMVNPDKVDQMIVLVNPAIEATPFLPLRDLTESLPWYLRQDDQRTTLKGGLAPEQAARALYDRPRRPLLAVFSSEGDWATRFTFPVGRFFSTIFERHESGLKRVNRRGVIERYSEWNLDRDALGNHLPFVTHRLSSAGGRVPEVCDAVGNRLGNLITSGGEAGRWGEGWVATFGQSQTTLKHLENSSAFSPVWVTAVDPELIKDHSSIWDARFSCFLEELVLLDPQPQSPP